MNKHPHHFYNPDIERLDTINENLSLIQIKDGLLFGTDALALACFTASDVSGKQIKAVELGGGSGVLSLLAARMIDIKSICCVELQEMYFNLAVRNIKMNRLTDVVTAVCGDIRSPGSLVTPDGIKVPVEDADIVLSNPPYMRVDSGAPNRAQHLNVARHEAACNISDVAGAARRLLRYGGMFYSVYRPDRLDSFMSALREHGLAPKKMAFLHPRRSSGACLVLVAAKKGGSEGLYVYPPVLIEEDGGINTDSFAKERR